MKKINDLLFKNIIWKCLSVVLATLLWLVCINVVNPIVTENYSSNLIIKNLEVVESNGYVLLNKDELENLKIGLTVKAVSNSFNTINNSHFQPFIDVSPIDYLREENIDKDQPLNIYVDRLGAASLSNFNPTSIETNPLKVYIKLDKVTEVTKPVTVTITGTAMDSFVALPGQTYPENISITGPTTVLNRISSVGVEVNVNGASEDLEIRLTPKIIDIDKRDITNLVEMNVDFVEVRVPINMYAKIPIQQEYVGKVAIDCDITAITRSIDYVEVVGAPEDILSVRSIKLPDLNVSGWSTTQSRSYDVRQELIDTKLSVVNGTPNEVIVTVNIEKQLKKEIVLSMDDVRVIGMLGNIGEVELPRGNLNIIVKGLPEKINDFDVSKISDASINIYMLEPGEHEVPVSILLPKGIYLDSEEPVIKITITEAAEEAPESEEDENIEGIEVNPEEE